MIRPRSPISAARIALLLVCLAALWLLPAGAAAAAEEAPTSTAPVTYTPESYAAYQQQVAAHQIQSVTINKRLRSLRVTLKDGRTVLAKYNPHQRPQVEAALRAAHVKFAILTAEQAKKEQKSKSKPKHKLRYIAGGLLIVVIIVVVAVVLVVRRRRARADY